MTRPIRAATAIHQSEPTPEEEAAWSAEIEVRKAELKQKHLEELRKRVTVDRGTSNVRWYQHRRGFFEME